MKQLLGPDGMPISSQQIQNKKAPAPALGESFGRNWGGEDDQIRIMALPGGGAIQFDLSMLTLDDFRQMKDHYQINSSLAVLTFMMHQMEWHVECDDKKQTEFYEENLKSVWTRLVRSMSQAFWAGFSPNVLQWENDIEGRRITLDKVKDLYPEDCKVHWKKVEGRSVNGTTRPKISIYDGIYQWGWPGWIPVENSYWYPLLMENGDHYGRKLLRPAFQSWFFSILLHLFANRYYERFGEPTPVGRAPFEDEIEVDGEMMKGNKVMGLLIQQLRSRAVVVLPNDKTPVGNETNPDYDYQLEYLESQMRGADFERYMTRLDEEMSLGLFTPILMMRTADVGSYNLGTQHTQVYLWMLNAISGDWAFYINKYILRPMRDFNFGPNAPLPKIQFRKTGKENRDLVRDIVMFLLENKIIKPKIEEIGEMSGLDFEQIQELTKDPEPSPEDPNAGAAKAEPDEGAQGDPARAQLARNVVDQIVDRVSSQVVAADRRGDYSSDLNLSMGYRRQLERSFANSGVTGPVEQVNRIFSIMESWSNDALEMQQPLDFVEHFRSTLSALVDMALP